MELEIIFIFGLFFLIGGTVLVFTWVFTKGVSSVWLRHLIRAVVAAVALTPTIVPAPEFHGSLPMPAAWVLFSIVFDQDLDSRLHLVYGGIPLLVAAFLYWSVASLTTYLIKKYAAHK